jgi:pantoate kinase
VTLTPRTSRAFAPSHITGFFQIFPNGSTGAGLNTDRGAITTVDLGESDAAASVEIFINDTPSEAPVSRAVLRYFEGALPERKLTIRHEIQYPIGYGTGMSGAGAFSLSLALNDAIGGPFTHDECMEFAVQSEISSGTGLGDVIAQRYHGIMIGLPPYPSRTVKVIPSDREFVVCGFFAALDTKTIIRDPNWREKISRIGGECMTALEKDLTVPKLIELCRYFTEQTGLANEDVRRVMKAIPESSMAMLGQTVFIVTDNPSEAEKKLMQFTDRVSTARVAAHGAKVL